MKIPAFVFLLSVLLQSAPNSYEFAVLGDRTSGVQPEIFAMFVEQVAKMTPAPAFCADVGDHIEGYQSDTALLTAQWTDFKKQLEPVTGKMPWHYTVGNHDISTPAVRPWFARQVGPRYYSFDYGPDHFAMLDNSDDRTDGILNDSAQLQWIRDDLGKNVKKRYTFVFYHKPVWSGTPTDKALDSLHQLFLSLGVDYVINGHYHSYYTGKRDNIRYLIVGSSGGETPNMMNDSSFYHCMKIKVSDKRIEWSFVLPDGTLLSGDSKQWKGNKHFTLQDSLSRTGARTDTLLFPVIKDGQRLPFTLYLSNPTDQPLLCRLSPVVYPEPSWECSPSFPDSIILPARSARTLKTNSVVNLATNNPSYRILMISQQGNPHFWYNGQIPLIIKKSMAVSAEIPGPNERDTLYACSRTDESHFMKAPLNPYDSAWLAFSYNEKELKIHFKCFDPHPDSLRFGTKARDAEMDAGRDHIRMYVAAGPKQNLPIFSIFVTPDGVIRDLKTIRSESGSHDSLQWNGASVINTRTTAAGYEGTLSVPWAALDLKGPQDFVFNARCGSSRFSKKLVRIAYQEPFERQPAACAMAKLGKTR